MKHNRKQFLKLSGTATTAALLSSFEQLAAKPISLTEASKGYELKIIATNWGFNGTMDAFCAKAKQAGYDGIENWWPGTIQEQQEMFDAVTKHGLALAIIWGADEGTFKEHQATFQTTLETFAKQKIHPPLYINLHSGRDYFSFDENRMLVEYSIALAKETGIPIYHETHRGRMMFAAHITNEFIKKYPELKLTLDISHWCNVHESLLHNQKQSVDAALQRTEHIHARVGYEEGPQVADPRAPEWKYAVDAHITWWDKVVEQKRKEGKPITILTEFGPPLYMQTLPYTLQPLSNQWEINVYMMELLRKRYT
jgi:sugar phosphate isomerase/epimerase